MPAGFCVLETVLREVVAGFSRALLAVVVGLLVVVAGLGAAEGGPLVGLEGARGTSSAGGATAVEANTARYLSYLGAAFAFARAEQRTLHTAQHVRSQGHVVGADTGEPGGALVDLRSRQAEELTR